MSFPPDRQIWLGGQQSGGTPGGGIRKPGVLSATIPDGQQRSGLLLTRSGGQQIGRVRGRTPMFPRRIGTLHLCCGGQHARPLAVLQHDRLLGQQPARPQHRVVRRLQHLRSHASSSSRQGLHWPVDGFAHRRPRGQHVFGPHRARLWGHRRNAPARGACAEALFVHPAAAGAARRRTALAAKPARRIGAVLRLGSRPCGSTLPPVGTRGRRCSTASRAGRDSRCLASS